MVANNAKFKITGSVGGLSASSNYVYRAVPGEVLTLELEDYGPVLNVTYELYGSGTDEQPLASYQAYDLTFAGATHLKLVDPPSGSTTITMPTQELDTHSWILRATASVAGVNQVFERKIVYSMGKPDKNIPGETTQSGVRGWYDQIAALIGSSLPFYDARGSTSNATPTTIGPGFMPPRNANMQLRGRLSAQVVGTAASFIVWDILSQPRTDNASPANISFFGATTFTKVLDESGGGFVPGTPTLVTSAGKLFPQVIGIAATNIRWHAFWDLTLEVF